MNLVNIRHKIYRYLIESYTDSNLFKAQLFMIVSCFIAGCLLLTSYVSYEFIWLIILFLIVVIDIVFYVNNNYQRFRLSELEGGEDGRTPIKVILTDLTDEYRGCFVLQLGERVWFPKSRIKDNGIIWLEEEEGSFFWVDSAYAEAAFSGREYLGYEIKANIPLDQIPSFLLDYWKESVPIHKTLSHCLYCFAQKDIKNNDMQWDNGLSELYNYIGKKYPFNPASYLLIKLVILKLSHGYIFPLPDWGDVKGVKF